MHLIMRLCVNILNGSLCRARFRSRNPGLVEDHRLYWVRWNKGCKTPASSRLEGPARLHPCQEDSNLLAQDRSIPSCHRSLENAAELGRSPGELNRVAESNCAREPTRRAGQRKPRLQTPCKWLQRHDRRTRSGAVNGSKAGWYRRPCVLTHPRRTPWVPVGTG